MAFFQKVRFFALAFLFVFSNSFFAQNINFWSDVPSEKLAKILVDKMSNEELFAQILMFGWAETQPSALLNSWVFERGLGSVKIFGWNTENTVLVARSVKSLQKKALSRPLQIPLFVATDQEGGWIRHVKGSTSVTPGNLALGADGRVCDAYYSGFYINREIAALGINMNFAPTVDLYTDKHSSVIGTRSFGDDPHMAGILGAAFAKGSLDAGVIPTAKHFPGHGDTSVDSHGRLPAIGIDEKTLQNRELVPFKYLIKGGVRAIMGGHLSFPKIRTNGEPATLSEFFLNKILRKNLGFEGLVITDDMMMNAMSYAPTLSVAYKMAVEAGNDIIISSRTANFWDAIWTENFFLVQTDENFKKKVKDAAFRVILEKLKYFKGKNSAPLFPDETKIAGRIPDKEGQKFFFEQACRAITFCECKKKFEDFVKEECGKILLCGSEPSFFSAAKKRWAFATEFRFDFSMTQNESHKISKTLPKIASDFDTVIFCVDNENSAYAAQCLKDFCEKGKRVVIFCVMSPVFVEGMEWASAIFLGYGYSPYTLEAMTAACAGEFVPCGVCPVSR